MKVEFRKSFEQDLNNIKDGALLQRIQLAIEAAERADNLSELVNIKKLKAAGAFYRIRVGDYRIGFSVKGNIVVFVRILHRKEIYRQFP